MLTGLKLPHSDLSSPSVGTKDITASLQEGDILFFFRTQLKVDCSTGVKESSMTLYHSEGNPSGPGALFGLRCDMAERISFTVICYKIPTLFTIQFRQMNFLEEIFHFLSIYLRLGV